MPRPQAPGGLVQRVGGVRAVVGYVLILVVGLLGAEYVSSSSPIPLLVPFNFLGYFPYYLAILAFAAAVGGLSFRSYYLLGAFLGLGMESFVTKVVWGHPDAYQPFSPVIGGFATWELFWLVLTYHPAFSVATPFMLASHYLGMPAARPLSTVPRRAMLAVLPILTGMLAAMASQPPQLVLAAFAVNAAVLAILLGLYRWIGARPRVKPGPVGWALVLVVGVGFAAVNFPQRYVPPLPTVAATVLALAVIALLAWRSIRLDRARPAPQAQPPGFRWRGLALYPAYWVVVEAVLYAGLTAVGDLRYVVILGCTVLAAVAGVVFLLVSAVQLVIARPRRDAGPPTPIEVHR